jgi:hypothetical protein
MKFLIMQFPPISRHIIPLRPKYYPQHPVVKHPRPIAQIKKNSEVKIKVASLSVVSQIHS